MSSRTDGQRSDEESVTEGSSPPVLERDAELETLDRVLADAGEGRGALLSVRGPMGIGKTCILDLGLQRAAALGFQCMQARAGEMESDYPFGVVLNLFGPFLSRFDDETRAGLLRGHASLASDLLLGSGEGEIGRGTEFSLIHGLYWFCVNASELQPLAIFVDDVHWADELSLRFLLYLSERVENLPIAVFVGERAGDSASDAALIRRLDAVSDLAALTPAPLSSGAVSTLLASTGVAELGSEAFASAVTDVSGGNPFLVSALLSAIRSDTEGWSARDTGRLGFFAPESVRLAVPLSIARCGPGAEELARACAVLGEEATIGRAAAVAELELADLMDAMAALSRASILDDGESLAFVHPMFRTAVLSELSGAERAQLHGRAARSLYEEGAASELIAYHLGAGVPVSDPWAVEILVRAARTAISRASPTTAVRLLERALECSPTPAQRSELLVDLGLAQAAAGQSVDPERFRDAIERLEDPARQQSAVKALGEVLYRSARFEDAVETFQWGARLSAGSEERELSFRASEMCASQMLPDAVLRADDWMEDFVAQGIPDPLPASHRPLIAMLANRRAQNRAPASEAGTLARLALGDGALLREQTSQSVVLYFAIEALMLSGEFDQALSEIDRAIADIRERGAAMVFGEASEMRALIMQARGNLPEAIADAEAVVAASEAGWEAHLGVVHGLLASCLVDKGQLDAARAQIAVGERHLVGEDDNPTWGWLLLARARLGLASGGDARAVLVDLERVGEIADRWQMRNPAVLPWRALAGLALLRLDRLEQAGDLVGEDLETAERFGVAWTVGRALRARAWTEADGVAVTTLERSVAVLEGSGADLELAKALIDRGAALRRCGHRVDARDPLRRGLDLAHHSGADAVAARARDELVASGARPRRAATVGVASLTPSERRIVDLAVEGHSNRAIAELLFLTKNTVDWHLRRAYRKLEVHSREELAKAVDGVADPGSEPAD